MDAGTIQEIARKSILHIGPKAITGFCAFVIYIFCVWFDSHPPITSADYAAWVQAIGSVGAIIGAIWIFSRQQMHVKLRDKEEVLQMQHSLHDELENWRRIFLHVIKNSLERSKKGEPVLTRFPIPDGPFPIFESCSNRLGKIENHIVRGKIVETYAGLKNFYMVLNLNNALLELFIASRDATRVNMTPENTHRHEEDRANLIAFSVAVHDECNRADKNIEEVLIKLRCS